MPPQYARSGAVCRTLGIDKRTLRKWGEEGGIAYIELRGQRHYDLASIATHGTTGSQAVFDEMPERIDVVYGRVSTRKQRDNLQRQLDQLTAKYPHATILSDCASGLNFFNRKGLKKVLQLAFKRRLRTLHIAYKDRLCRFGYDLIEYVLNEHGANIVVEERDEEAASPERELADDLVSIVSSLGARLHGKRSGGNRKGPRQEEGEGSSDSGSSDADRTAGHGREAQEKAGTLHTQRAAGGVPAHVQDQDDSDS